MHLNIRLQIGHDYLCYTVTKDSKTLPKLQLLIQLFLIKFFMPS